MKKNKKHSNIKNNSAVSCHICHKVLSKKQIRDHIRLVHSGRQFQCEKCPKAYKTSSHLKEHVEWKHNGITLKCKYCGKILRSRQGLRNHDCSGNFCKRCKQTFRSISGLKNHQPCNSKKSQQSGFVPVEVKIEAEGSDSDFPKFGNDDNELSCGLCQKVFSTVEGLKIHMHTCKVHSTQTDAASDSSSTQLLKSFCNLCGVNLTTDFLDHMQMKHGIKLGDFLSKNDTNSCVSEETFKPIIPKILRTYQL